MIKHSIFIPSVSNVYMALSDFNFFLSCFPSPLLLFQPGKHSDGKARMRPFPSFFWHEKFRILLMFLLSHCTFKWGNRVVVKYRVYACIFLIERNLPRVISAYKTKYPSCKLYQMNRFPDHFKCFGKHLLLFFHTAFINFILQSEKYLEFTPIITCSRNQLI